MLLLIEKKEWKNSLKNGKRVRKERRNIRNWWTNWRGNRLNGEKNLKPLSKDRMKKLKKWKKKCKRLKNLSRISSFKSVVLRSQSAWSRKLRSINYRFLTQLLKMGANAKAHRFVQGKSLSSRNWNMIINSKRSLNTNKGRRIWNHSAHWPYQCIQKNGRNRLKSMKSPTLLIKRSGIQRSKSTFKKDKKFRNMILDHSGVVSMRQHWMKLKSNALIGRSGIVSQKQSKRSWRSTSRQFLRSICQRYRWRRRENWRVLCKWVDRSHSHVHKTL